MFHKGSFAQRSFPLTSGIYPLLLRIPLSSDSIVRRRFTVPVINPTDFSGKERRTFYV